MILIHGRPAPLAATGIVSMSKPSAPGPSAAIASRARPASAMHLDLDVQLLEQVALGRRRLEAEADVRQVAPQERPIVRAQRVGAGDLQRGAADPEPDPGR